VRRADRAVYAIEATCHAPSFEGIYGEIYKCLKPGGVVSFGFRLWLGRWAQC
jgi:sterol 24-C-methyltransferase